MQMMSRNCTPPPQGAVQADHAVAANVYTCWMDEEGVGEGVGVSEGDAVGEQDA